MNALRSVGAVIAGLVVAYVVMILMELLTARVYPMPAGVGLADMEALRSWIQQLPTTAFLIVAVGWALGAFLGGMVAAKLAATGRIRHAMAVGVVLLLAGIANLVRIPHPLWMWFAAFVLFVPGAYLGARMLEKKTTPAQS